MAINNSNLWIALTLAVLRPKSSQGIEDNSGTNYHFFSVWNVNCLGINGTNPFNLSNVLRVMSSLNVSVFQS